MLMLFLVLSRSWCRNFLIDSVHSFHIGETLSIVLQEWLSWEKQLCINAVIFDLNQRHVLGFDLECAFWINFNRHLWLLFLSIFEVLLALVANSSVLIKDFSFKFLHFFFIIEVAVKLHELIRHCEEHHSPRLNRVIVVLLNYAPGSIEVVLMPAKEIKVRLQVIVLNSKSAIGLLWLLNLVEKIDCLLHSVL